MKKTFVFTMSLLMLAVFLFGSQQGTCVQNGSSKTFKKEQSLVVGSMDIQGEGVQEDEVDQDHEFTGFFLCYLNQIFSFRSSGRTTTLNSLSSQRTILNTTLPIFLSNCQMLI